MAGCRNCSHSQGEHEGEAGRCRHRTQTAVERVECTCPAFNVRPSVPTLDTLPPGEQARVLRGQINDLERQIRALTAQRDAKAKRLRDLVL